ncbi:MAG: helix-turn-helix domain-containing protein [Nitrosopumilales archaeon]|nr:MAG: helix-turn-helix domain-containing protein [Nitrosopumilales archaeon]
MTCSIVRLYVSEDASTYSVDEVTPTLKLKKKSEKSGKLSTGSKWIFEKIKFLCNNPNGPGYCFASNEYFMKEFGVKSDKTIRRWLEPLKKQGLIRTEENNVRTANGWVRRRKIYISKNVCGTVTLDRIGPVRLDRYNEPFKEEYMNDSEALQSSSSLLKTSSEKASPKQNLMKYYHDWCKCFDLTIDPNVYKRWRRLDPEESYVDETFKKLHLHYKTIDPSYEFEEKQLQASLRDNYYHLNQPNPYGNGLRIEQN